MPAAEEKKSPRVTYNPAAVAKYVKEKYDRVDLKLPKGRLDTLKAHALKHRDKVTGVEEKHRGSVNSFINRAIDETIERDNKASKKPGGLSEREAQKESLKAFE